MTSLMMPHTLKALESELAYQEQNTTLPLLAEEAGYYQLFAELDHLGRVMMVAKAKGDPGRARDVLREMAARCVHLMNTEPVEPRKVYIGELSRAVPVDELRTCTLFDTTHPKGMSYRLVDGQYVLDIPETDPADNTLRTCDLPMRRRRDRDPNEDDWEDEAPRPRSNTAEAIDRSECEMAWEQVPYVHQDWVELDTAFDRIARQLGQIYELDTLSVPHAGDLFFIKDIGEYCILTAVIPAGHSAPVRGTYMLRDSRVNRDTGKQFDTAAGRMGGYNENGDVVSFVSVPYDQTTWQEHDRRGIARLRDDQEWETDLLSLPEPQRSDLFYVNAKKSYCIILRAPVVDGAPGEYMLRYAINRTALDERAPYRVGDSHGRPTPPEPPLNELVSMGGEVREKELPPGSPGFTVRHKPGVPDGFDVVTDQTTRR